MGLEVPFADIALAVIPPSSSPIAVLLDDYALSLQGIACERSEAVNGQEAPFYGKTFKLANAKECSSFSNDCPCLTCLTTKPRSECKFFGLISGLTTQFIFLILWFVLSGGEIVSLVATGQKGGNPPCLVPHSSSFSSSSLSLSLF
jgi:hypothetical protein